MKLLNNNQKETKMNFSLYFINTRCLLKDVIVPHARIEVCKASAKFFLLSFFPLCEFSLCGFNFCPADIIMK